MIRQVLAALTLSALIGAGWWINHTAWQRGYAVSEAEHAEAAREAQAALDEAQAAHRETVRVMLEEERARLSMQRRLTLEALQYPGADCPAYDAGRVRILNEAR